MLESVDVLAEHPLDQIGNRQSGAELGGRSIAWTYDGIYRMTNETITSDPHTKNGSVSYGLDSVGNRLSVTSTLAAILSGTFTYNANDGLSTETYDNNGNVLTSGGKAFKYDFENRLKDVNNGQIQMFYDGDGNRVSKTIAGTVTTYLVDDLNPTGYAQVVEVLVGGAVQRTYTYGSSRISERQLISSTWQTSFYGYDGPGSVRLLTDSAGTVTDTYDYDAFGGTVNSTGSTPNSYLYRGEQYDPDLGLYYLRARYLNPVTGRFLTRDPAAGKRIDPITLHKYLYANADPVNKSDPSGRSGTGTTNWDGTRTGGGDLLEYAGLLVFGAEVIYAGIHADVIAEKINCIWTDVVDALRISANSVMSAPPPLDEPAINPAPPGTGRCYLRSKTIFLGDKVCYYRCGNVDIYCRTDPCKPCPFPRASPSGDWIDRYPNTGGGRCL